MAVNTITYTGVIGPGTSLTTKLFDDVRNFSIDYDEQTITINYGPRGNVKQAIVSLAGTTTFTYTITGGIATITIS